MDVDPDLKVDFPGVNPAAVGSSFGLSFGADSVIVVVAAGVPVVSVLPNATTAAATPKLRTTAMIMAIQPNCFGLGAATAAGLAVSAGQEILAAGT
jgi:hypothetical protein